MPKIVSTPVLHPILLVQQTSLSKVIYYTEH